MSTEQLTQNEFNRYIQQIKLEKIGPEGQLKLKHAKVLCIGAGGLGSPLLQYLAAAGIGTLGIVDHDHIEPSNLHRQILYHEKHIGAKKAVIAQQQLLAANPYIHIHSYHEKIAASNAEPLIGDYDIIADCTDNFNARYLINDYCFKLGKPYVTASVMQFSGQCSTFLGMQGPCFRCLFPSPPAAGVVQNCNEEGVLGILPGLFGLIQSTEIIKWILQIGDSLVGRVLVIDILKMFFREFQLSANPDCNVCASSHILKPSQNQKEKLPMSDDLISVSELKKLLETNRDLQLIDVRTPEKHQSFNIGGRLLPFDELPHRLSELDAAKPIVTYCTSGGRSMMALQFLRSAGFNLVKSLDGGMTAWLGIKMFI